MQAQKKSTLLRALLFSILTKEGGFENRVCIATRDTCAPQRCRPGLQLRRPRFRIRTRSTKWLLLWRTHRATALDAVVENATARGLWRRRRPGVLLLGGRMLLLLPKQQRRRRRQVGEGYRCRARPEVRRTTQGAGSRTICRMELKQWHSSSSLSIQSWSLW